MTHHIKKLSVLGICLLAVLSGCGNSDPAKSLAAAKAAFAKHDYNTANIELKNALQQNPKLAEARLLFGEVLLEQDDAVGAEKELRKALDAGAPRDKVWPLLAIAMKNMGQTKKLIEEMDGKQLSDPAAMAQLNGTLGLAYLAEGKQDQAKQRFDTALKVDPKQAQALLGYARLQAMDKKTDLALQTVDKVLASQPNMLDALILRGDLYATAGKQKEAVAAYQAAIKAQPKMMRPYQSLMAYYFASGDYDALKKQLVDLQKLAPKHPQTLYFKGVIAAHDNKFGEARDALMQVIRVAPDHVPSAMLAAYTQMKLGEMAQAQDILKRLVTQNPDLAAARKMLAEAYIDGRDAINALEVLQPLLKKTDGKDPEVFNLAGQAYLLAGDYKQSSEYFARYVQLRPQSADAQTRLGLSNLAKGDEGQALKQLEAAAALDKQGVQADVALVMAYLKKNDLAKAHEALANLEKKQPQNPLTQNVKGLERLAAKDDAGARAAFEKALELQPNFLAAALNLARMDIRDKKTEHTRERFEKIIDKNPNSPNAYLTYAQLLPELGGKPEEVQKILERAVTALPTKAELRVALVRSLLEAKEAQKALAAAQNAQAALPDNTDIMLLLGRTQALAGELQQASATYSKLVTMQGDVTTALVELSDVQKALGQDTASEQSLRKAISLKPDLLEAQQRLLSVLIDRNRYAEALVLAKDVQKQRPNAAAGFAMEAEVHGRQKHWPEALAAMSMARKYSKAPALVPIMHTAYVESGKPQEAQKVVDQWFKENPKDIYVHNYLATRYSGQKQYAQAAKEYEAMLAIVPNAAGTMNNLAWVLGQEEQFPKAIEYAERANKLAPNVPALMETLGTLLVNAGQKDRGIKILKDAVTLDPRQTDVRLGYAKALMKVENREEARRELEQILQVAPARSKAREEASQILKAL